MYEPQGTSLPLYLPSYGSGRSIFIKISFTESKINNKKYRENGKGVRIYQLEQM